MKKNMAFPGISFKEIHKYTEAFSASLTHIRPCGDYV